MRAPQKILSTLLLAMVMTNGCKKSEQRPVVDNLDNIAGTYVGKHKYYERHSGGHASWDLLIDTTTDADTFIIVRLSVDSFFIYTTSKYSFTKHGWIFQYNDSNHWVQKYAPVIRDLKFLYEKDSIYYAYKEEYGSGVMGYYYAKETFDAKKVR
ncbi:MAG: hypothetical protein K0Q79_942 [Flavipsychrobacter sp.]|jgi:hypothetical protein|nr:hypothetical protein [Flavipsychrobacter sp.]